MPSPGTVIQLTDALFSTVVSNPAMPTLVAFTASWCPHCPDVEKLLPQIAGDFSGKAQICQCDVDKCPSAAQSQEIQCVPTVCFYASSETNVECLCGGRSLAEYEQELATLLKVSILPKSRNKKGSGYNP